MINELFDAIDYNDLAKVNRLLSTQDININQVNELNWTPLYMACFRGNFEIVERLLQVPEIDVNQSNTYSRPPLYGACCRGDVKIVKRLLQVPGIDVNQVNKPQFNPLETASSNGYHAIVRILSEFMEMQFVDEDHSFISHDRSDDEGEVYIIGDNETSE